MADNHEAIERKNEVLKREIESMILRQNKEGLNSQENHLMQRFIKELHHNSYIMR